MTLNKESKRIHIPLRIKKADSFVSRLLGLMLRRTLPEKEGLLLVPCNSIHMFFMRFPIDAVLLDEHNRILKIVENLRPWSMVPPVRSARSTLELPAGTVKRYGMNIGDELLWNECK